MNLRAVQPVDCDGGEGWDAVITESPSIVVDKRNENNYEMAGSDAVTESLFGKCDGSEKSRLV